MVQVAVRTYGVPALASPEPVAAGAAVGQHPDERRRHGVGRLPDEEHESGQAAGQPHHLLQKRTGRNQ